MTAPTWEWPAINDREGDLPALKRLLNLRLGRLRDRLNRLQTDLGWINVADSGATGNGTTDDTVAIEKAMSKMGDNALLFFPPGQYRITGRPTCPNYVNNVYFGEGVELLLDDPAATGFRLSGSYSQLSFEGFRITAAAGLTDSVGGISTDVTPGAFVGGSAIRFVDVKVLGANRGIFLDLQNAGDWRDVEFWGCRMEQVVGTASGRGYGIAGTIWGGSVSGCYFDQCGRHSLYLSISQNVNVGLNTFRRHRFGLGSGAQLGALEIARSGSISAIGNTFDTCDDGAVSIEPHEADATAYTRGIVLAQNTFLNSVRQDVFVGGPSDPSAMSDLTDITIQGNQFQRTEGATAASESIRHYHGKRLRVLDNQWTLPNAYIVTKDLIVTNALGGEVFSEGFEAARNRVYVTAGGGGALQFLDLSAAQSAGALPVLVVDNTVSGGAPTALVAYQAARTNTVIGLRGNTVNGAAVSDSTAIGGLTWEQAGPITLRSILQTPSAQAGTDVVGNTLNVIPGAGTGVAAPGEVRIFLANPGASGTTPQSLYLALRLIAEAAGINSIRLNAPTAGAGHTEIQFHEANVVKADLGLDTGGGGLIAGSVQGDLSIFTRGGRILWSADSGNTLHGLVNGTGVLQWNAAIRLPYRSTGSDITAADSDFTIDVDASGANRVITLLPASTRANQLIQVRKLDASANTVTVDGDGAELINGAATFVLTAQYESVSLQCTGAGWVVL